MLCGELAASFHEVGRMSFSAYQVAPSRLINESRAREKEEEGGAEATSASATIPVPSDNPSFLDHFLVRVVFRLTTS